MNIKQLNALSAHQAQAMFIAMVVRNAMENFHVDHLTDAQMAELNPIIRNAIYTALKIYDEACNNEVTEAQMYMGYILQMIPDYWERPVNTFNAHELPQFLQAFDKK